MKKTQFIILVCLVIVLMQILTGSCFANLNIDPANAANDEKQNIYKLIKEAMEYNDWINKPDYEVKLTKFYAGEALDDITNSVKDFREMDTDWYNLTFLQNCHIVYSSKNNAVAMVHLKYNEITTNDIQWGKGILSLHKTKLGWRITKMIISQESYTLN